MTARIMKVIPDSNGIINNLRWWDRIQIYDSFQAKINRLILVQKLSAVPIKTNLKKKMYAML